jgi:hypothetical protein
VRSAAASGNAALRTSFFSPRRQPARYPTEQVNPMKRKPVYAHRTRKMSDDFLQWLGERTAAGSQEADKHTGRADQNSRLALMVWADDGGRITGADSVVSRTRNDG